MSVLFETTAGDITIDLFCDECPVTTKNFLKLCKIKYFNNNLFFNVQKDFLIQTGDPTGTGKGGESIYKALYGDQARYFDDEIKPSLKHRKGSVSMANAGPNTNASQFFITTGDDCDYLNGKHTVFGEVAEGMETVMKINSVFVDGDNRPFKNVRVLHTIILDDPFDDPKGLVVPPSSPIPTIDQFELERLGAADDVVDTRSAEEIEADLRARAARSRAEVLEMLGDIPDADIKPPDNVLFVCKLHPVTRSEDLELIFSRFGKIKSCEVIRDFKTGDSLQYAFIEFENAEQCEQAYLKMENVQIDDRRIHVDFSQSVARLWGAWRRGDRNINSKFDASGKSLGDAKLQLKSGGGGRRGNDADLVFSHSTSKRPRSSTSPPGGGSSSKRHKTDTERKDASRGSGSGKREDERRGRDSSRERERKRSRDRDTRDNRDRRDKDKDRDRDDRRRHSSRDRDSDRGRGGGGGGGSGRR